MIPYSMLIQWSEEDNLFLVTFPELSGPDLPHTHGATYEEAARNGQEVLEELIDAYQHWKLSLPPPSLIRMDEWPVEDEGLHPAKPKTVMHQTVS